MFLIVIHLFVSVCRAVVPRQPLVVMAAEAAATVPEFVEGQCDSPTRLRLTYYKFLRFACKGNEIHAFGQIGNINLLGFSGDVA